MKEKKNIILMLLCGIICIVLIGYSAIRKNEKDPMDNYISKAIVAKDVALIFHSQEEIEKLEVDKFNGKCDSWFVDYANMMYEDEYFTTSMVKERESSWLEAMTYDDLDELFTNIGVADKKLLSFAYNNKGNQKIEMTVWWDILKCMIEKLSTNKSILIKESVIIGNASNLDLIDKWSLKTTTGTYKYTGLSTDYYIDKRVNLCLKGDEILFVGGVVDEKVTYKNALVITMQSGKIKAYINGAIREFVVTDKSASYSNVISNIYMKSGKIEKYDIITDTVGGKIASVGDDYIEFEKHGRYELDSDIKVYKTYGSLAMMKKNDILVGYDMGVCYISDGKVVATVMDRDIEAENIRVLLMNTGFTEIYHDEISMFCETGMTVTSGENTYDIEAGQYLTLNINHVWLKEGRIKVAPKGNNTKITVASIERSQGMPSYRGEIDICVNNGRLIMINELPIEKYLLSVVPSEMPYTYNIEALKAQAICARSFAYKQLRNNTYSAFGAHVDDSTNFQVYNNSTEQESTTQAVEETYGRIITYKEEIIDAFFFSTSCGSTTDSSIWNQKLGYTASRKLMDEESNMDLTNESTFDAFIRVSMDTYDSEYPWYRWSVKLTLKELQNMIDQNLQSVCNNASKAVSVEKEDGSYENESVVSVGKIKKIEVIKRGAGGVVDTLKIYGSEKTIIVEKELNIRKLFGTSGYTIKRVNGEDVTDMKLLPSAYIIFDPVIKNGIIKGYTIMGGGYGHGVGLSQNGANYLGRKGFDYEEIIKFFYNEVEITKK